jgi:hypothetical protein
MRQDVKKNLTKIFMKAEEAETCKFEPNVGTLARNPKTEEEKTVPGGFFEKLGDNFMKSNPQLFKKGKLKKARLELKRGNEEDSFKCLVEGFDLLKVFQHFLPQEYKVWKEGKKAQEELLNKDKKPDTSAKKPKVPVMGQAAGGDDKNV